MSYSSKCVFDFLVVDDAVVWDEFVLAYIYHGLCGR